MRQSEYDVCKDVCWHLNKQLSSFWKTDEIDWEQMFLDVSDAIKKTEKDLLACNKIFPNRDGFSIINTNAYAGFLYHLSHAIGIRGDKNISIADKIYYLNKVMNGVEWYWNIELPEHFLCEHPIGSVLGKAEYGDYLCIYQGVTVGANFVKEDCIYPVLGEYVTLYANAVVLGSSRIGNNVIVAANAFVMNETIHDNCVVFGSSPHLIVREYSQKEIRDKIARIWNFPIQ